MHEPPRDVVHEVVLVTEATKLEKKNNLIEAVSQIQEYKITN